MEKESQRRGTLTIAATPNFTFHLIVKTHLQQKINREHRMFPAAHGLFVYLIVSIEIHAAINPRLPPVYFIA